MRYIYADESGISVNESILVVAGVIIHADLQWKPVEQHIRALILKYVPEEHRDHKFVFEAKHLFSGSGPIFKDRDRYTLGHRLEILKELLSIPAKFKLPMVFGFTRKEEITPTAERKVAPGSAVPRSCDSLLFVCH